MCLLIKISKSFSIVNNFKLLVLHTIITEFTLVNKRYLTLFFFCKVENTRSLLCFHFVTVILYYLLHSISNLLQN